ncbi:golgi associated, gamma adaptin ear containing, ARF binding protein 3 [Phyllostomus discolor]|uniref:ADP-ribosylation factor-binding protein GGA3 n=3 Tax=Phyllostomus discolor TaxID=89673 RepID=A0A6J2MEA0_9CHIR|nr:ADP-ribosylation factor-binding protein GGA3 [Phyllostomus discolor]KAF6093940.1 golgi associated, gamma adaptin ear containing, ARF binding protein 3 [Phyllostomus discolor]
MAETEGESLESWLNKATNPCNRQEDWEYIIGFCDQINRELEGPQIAVRLLAHKIQSPQEWEAVQALTVLEACMKNCGRRFHNEVGKFRFLNELIKVVSPKYLGDRVSEKVKTKVIELLYSWTLALPEESKIRDAYHMLKRQGIVQSDPPIPVDRTLIPSPPPRPKNPVFDDEEKSKLLAKLLKSKNPDDLQEANKLIKSMVKEDEARTQKVTERLHTLEEVNNNVKLLSEMLLHYSKEESSEADKELMKELFDRCESRRRTLFKLASETEDNDSSLGDILQASDNLSRVINSYKTIVEGQVINGELSASTLPDSEGNHHSSSQGALIDLVELDAPSSPPPALAPAPPAPSSGIPILPPPPQPSGPGGSRSSSQAEAPPGPSSTSNALCLLDEELLCLGLADPAPTAPPKESVGNGQWPLFQNEQSDLDFFGPQSGTAACSPPNGPVLQPSATPAGSAQALLPPPFPAPAVPASVAAQKAGFLFPTGPPPASAPKPEPTAPGHHGSAVGDGTLNKLDALDQLLEEAKVTSGLVKPVASSFFPAATTSPLVPPGASARPFLPFCTGPGSPLFQPPACPSPGSPVKGPELSLASVHVPLESIKPSNALPVTAYDKNGFRILFHFAKECPPGRPDVLVVVVSMLNTAPLPIKSIVLQAAVPKSMKVKLQPPSGTELSPFSPVQPPAAITQVMLLANPLKEKARLRYRLTFALGEQLSTEVGEVDQFPPVEQWGNL